MRHNSQTWSLISLGVSLNLVLGALVAALKIPLYLDSVGTLLVGLCAGSGAGSITGAVGILILSLSSPSALPFLPVACLVGGLAGKLRSFGVLGSRLRLVLAGAFLGVVSAAVSAPIATVVFGGVTGGGTDLLVALFRAGGQDALGAAFLQSLTVDPADKLVSLFLAAYVLGAVPARALTGFGKGFQVFRQEHHGQPRPYRPWPRPSGKVGRGSPFAGAEGETDFYLVANGLLGRAGPGLKLLCLALVCLAAFFCQSWERAAGILGLLVGATLMAAPGIWRKSLGLSWPILLPLLISVGLIQGGFGPKAPGSLWSSQGLATAGLLWCRVGVLVWSTFCYLLSTPLERFAELLIRWRLPYPLVFTVVTGVNLAPRFRAHLELSLQSAQSRGLTWGEGGVMTRLRQLRAVVTPALHNLFSELPTRSAALESRGFGLSGRPTETPGSWRREPAPTVVGNLFCIILAVLAGMGCWWP